MPMVTYEDLNPHLLAAVVQHLYAQRNLTIADTICKDALQQLHTMQQRQQDAYIRLMSEFRDQADVLAAHTPPSTEPAKGDTP